MTLLIIVLLDLSGNLPFSRPFCLVKVASCEPLHIIAIARDGKPGITLSEHLSELDINNPEPIADYIASYTTSC